nr:glutathione S-transferase kappa 1 [Zootoca vivipara]
MLAFLARAPRPLLSGSAGSPGMQPMAAARRGLGSSSSISKKLVECFYDVLSPYSWLGFEVLCRYRPIWNMELRFRPVFLGGIMHATGNKAPALVPKKGEYMGQGCITRSPPFGSSESATGSTLLIEVSDMAPLFVCVSWCFIPCSRRKLIILISSLSLTQSFSCPRKICNRLPYSLSLQDEDITQPESILAAAERAGLPSDQARKLLEMSSSPEVKNRLKATTEEALKYGAFGLPCFVTHVNEEPHLLFGTDRLELLGNLLGEKWLGPVPTSSKL